MAPHPDDSKDSGMALFVVLAFLLLVAAVITPITVSAHIQAKVTRNTINQTQDRFAVQGILRLAAAGYLQKARELSESPTARMPAAVICAGGREDAARVTLTFVDHSGLIDLNAAPRDLVAAGFRALGLEAGRAAAFALAVDRRRTLQTGESGQVSAAIPFDTVFQLADLAPNGEALDASIVYGPARSVFTVHSGAGTVDVSRSLPQLARLLERFGVDRTAFLVENADRLPALTVEAAVAVPGRPVLVATGVFAPDDSAEKALLRPLEPTRIARIDAGEFERTRGERPPQRGCDAVMNAGMRRAMFEVLG